MRTAKVYLLSGELTPEDVEKIKHYVINPVEAREAGLEPVDTLQVEYEVPTSVETVTGFTALDEAGLAELLDQLGLAMDLDDLKFLQAHFRDEEHRDPTITEIRVVDTYWSDHCRHTTFSTHIDAVEVLDEATQKAYQRYLSAREEVYGPEKAAVRPQTLMDMATIGAKVLKKRGLLSNLDQSEEINACSIHVTATVNGEAQDWLLMFKNETHNHPTEIEPFGGAATCIGGCIRDPLSGRAYVYQAMRVTGCGDPRTPVSETIPGKLPQRKLAQTAAAGYSSYGNQIGLATGQVSEVYHPGYVAKHLEVGAVVGAAPADNVVRERPAPGDVVILLGGRTGRDGIGGATGSSKSHNRKSLTTMASEVQKGNAPEERKIQRLFRDGNVTRLIKRCNDFGAGGVSVAIGELADGLEIELDAVRKKYEGLDGTELAISESQERMAVVVAAQDADTFIAAAQRENLEAYRVAVVTESPRMVMHWQGQTIVNLSRAFLDTNGAIKHTQVAVKAADRSSLAQPLFSSLREMAGSLNLRLPPRPFRALRLHHRRGQRADALRRQVPAYPHPGHGSAAAGAAGPGDGGLLRHGLGLRSRPDVRGSLHRRLRVRADLRCQAGRRRLRRDHRLPHLPGIL
ncbi:MAG: AIR synthase-related protein [Dysosmobacter sp.]